MDINERKKKFSVVNIIIVLIIVTAIIGIIGLAYARYITSINGNSQVAIARWNFNVTAGSTQSLNIDLAQTRLANDTDQVDRSTVAPGTAGALVLNVDASRK